MKINHPFSSIRWKIVFAFLLIVLVGYYVVALSLVSLVGDYLFDDHKQKDLATSAQLAVELSPLFSTSQMAEINERIVAYSGELGSRVILVDMSGKVQADSYASLNGIQLSLSELVSVLTLAQDSDYGLYDLNQTAESTTAQTLLGSTSQDWVSYATSSLSYQQQVIGAVLLCTPVQSTMQQLLTLQNQMFVYFVVASIAVLGLAILFSRIITKPIVSLTKSIQVMARGDFSVRVPVRGSGELRHLSETFNTMSEKLETLDQSRNQFVSNASHELKTPLTTMKILLESVIYQPDMPSDMRTEFMTDINKEIDRLNQIISDLLTLVSMDAKTMTLSPTIFYFADIVNNVAEKLALVAKPKHQTIALQLDQTIEIFADEAKLLQVVYNLLDNAIKYSYDNSTITLTLEKVGKNLVFRVIDQGHGIPKADQAHIFDRFYRVDKARSRDTGGTGLGLSIVHQLVLLHDGAIAVESEEEKGSTFTLTLPLGEG